MIYHDRVIKTHVNIDRSDYYYQSYAILKSPGEYEEISSPTQYLVPR